MRRGIGRRSRRRRRGKGEREGEKEQELVIKKDEELLCVVYSVAV